jgi:hypothetical protein
VNVRVIAEVGAPAVLHAKKRSANHTQTTQMRQVLEMSPKALPVMSILGGLNGMRIRITPSQPQNSPPGQQSPLIHPVHGMMLRRAVGSTSLLQDLGLVSSTACLLLPHKINLRSSPNPLRHNKIRLISKTSAISLRARPWSQRLTPCSSLPATAMMNGLRTAWLNWREKWDWLW